MACRSQGCGVGTPASSATASGSPTWTNLTNPAAVSPLWTYYSAMTYDNASQSVLLFGSGCALDCSHYGTGGGEGGNQSWEFSRGQWKNVTPTLSPPAQGQDAMTYDALDGSVLLFGCSLPSDAGSSPGTECNDTWTFSGGAWREVVGSNPLVADVRGSGSVFNQLSLAYLPSASSVILTNGNATWSYQSGIWTPLCLIPNCSTGFIPGPNLEGVAAYDAHDGYVLFVGSSYRGGCSSCGGIEFRGNSYTWKFSHGQWTNISGASGTPPPRLDASLAYDTSTGSAVLFGGWGGYERLNDLNDTWSFQGGTWTNVTSARAPSGRTDTQMADDPPDASIVLFSGFPYWPDNATWAWSANPPLSQLSVSVTPPRPVPGSTATFNATFRGGIGPFSYSWRFGDGDSSRAATPSHTYSADGVYKVSVWVNDSTGHSINQTIPVVAYLPLEVTALQASPSPAVLGQLVTFTVTAQAGTPPYSYSWLFGDGTTGGNLSTIAHAYSTTGAFVAQVSVTDAVGTLVTEKVSVQVNRNSPAGFTSSPWFWVLVGVSAGVILVAAIWAGTVLRRRSRQRKEGRGSLDPAATSESKPPDQIP